MSEPAALILIIEDDAPIRCYLQATLRSFGYSVAAAACGQEGLAMVARLNPDLILLDLGLPDLDGLELAKNLRTWSQTPIIVVSARGKEEDKIQALDLGADDYLTKPFGSGELLARIRVALRHAAESGSPASEATVTVGALRVDFASHQVTLDGQETHLSPNEFALLAVLARHAGKVLTHRQLLREVWGGVPAAQPTYLRVYMAGLRKKLEPDPARPRLLLTEPGVGYRLNG